MPASVPARGFGGQGLADGWGGGGGVALPLVRRPACDRRGCDPLRPSRCCDCIGLHYGGRAGPLIVRSTCRDQAQQSKLHGSLRKCVAECADETLLDLPSHCAEQWQARAPRCPGTLAEVKRAALEPPSCQTWITSRRRSEVCDESLSAARAQPLWWCVYMCWSVIAQHCLLLVLTLEAQTHTCAPH